MITKSHIRILRYCHWQRVKNIYLTEAEGDEKQLKKRKGNIYLNSRFQTKAQQYFSSRLIGRENSSTNTW